MFLGFMPCSSPPESSSTLIKKKNHPVRLYERQTTVFFYNGPNISSTKEVGRRSRIESNLAHCGSIFVTF